MVSPLCFDLLTHPRKADSLIESFGIVNIITFQTIADHRGQTWWRSSTGAQIYIQHLQESLAT